MAKQIHLLCGVVRPAAFDKAFPDEVELKIFSLLNKYSVHHLDTGRAYGNAEAILGRLKAGPDHGFKIDTKWLGGFFDPTSITKDRIIADAKDSFSKLGVEKIHSFYLHSPFVTPDIEETLIAINEVHKMGIFEHFGLSNFTPEQVQQVYDICKAKGLVLPTVYEGLYNPVNRKPEEELLPLLRKLTISFNAYSVLAGGFLLKSREHIVNEEGRFAKDQYRGLYGRMYNNEPFLEAHDTWARIAEEEGVTKLELAYRWVCYHSSLKAELGDGVIVGGWAGQFEETFDSISRGPLTEQAVERIQGLWEKLQPNVKYLHNLQAMQ